MTQPEQDVEASPRASGQRGPPRPGPLRRLVRLGRGRWWRVPVLVVAGYLALALIAQGTILAMMPLARLTGHDPRADGADLPTIQHLRQVDEKVWAGAQAEPADYRSLADRGVELVVDMRTGGPGDPRKDDPAFLRSLGMEYLWLPITDGHAPAPAQVRRFAEAVAAADGPVYVHCGGGVGRTGTMVAAYLAATGRDPGVLEMMAVGPPTVEQIWHVGGLDPGEVEPTWPAARVFSRFVIDAPRTAVNWVIPRV